MSYLFRKTRRQHYIHDFSIFIDEHRQGHIHHCKRVVSCLAKFKWSTIMINTEEPDFSSMPTNPHDWEESFYGKIKELTPHDVPAPLKITW